MKPEPEISVAYSPPESRKPTNSVLLRILVGLQLFIALSGLLFSSDSWPAASATIALLLAMVLFSRERVDDERVRQLKLKAISYGLITGLLAASLLNTGRKFFQPSFMSRPISAFELLIVILLIALGLFHYWRWQDGNDGETH